MNLNSYKEDLEKQESGSPFYMGEDACFYVKRVGTTQYSKQIEEIKRNIYGFAAKDIDWGLVLGTWLAEHGVTGWDNILDESDNKLDYSVLNARKVFLNPSFFNSLNAQLISYGSDYANYLFDEVTEDVDQIKKN